VLRLLVRDGLIYDCYTFNQKTWYKGKPAVFDERVQAKTLDYAKGYADGMASDATQEAR